MARIDSFLSLVVDQNASDLHLHAGARPQIRYLGDLIPLPFRVLTDQETARFILEILSPEQQIQLERDKSTDFAYVLDGVGRFRANVFQQSRGLGGVFRVINDRSMTIDELRLPPVLRDLTAMQNGLVLVTGPTGSGKTTTLTAMIDEINRTSRRHVITIEDPVEYIHVADKAIITQRELGTHTNNTAMALRSALREAPDVLVVGELRDFESVGLALSAAETGVLVLGTLHTNSAAKAIDRLISACPEDAQQQVMGVLSVLLKGVVAQRLCKLSTGDGRVAAVEVLLQSYAVAHLIREGKVYQLDAYLKTGEHAGTGMQSLDSSLLAYIREGLITLEEGLVHANEPDVLRAATLGTGGGALLSDGMSP
ncbi:MAG: PilT/PilU family type 4a pilus ATPase [Myxococcales bacterium]|nr:PilT/PilU family type 4a pilus ATPase [Myxococcales bacterium]